MDQAATPSRGVSLHIGLNFVDPAHYAGWDGKLLAAEADAAGMRAIAEAKGFAATSLIREAATRQAVTDAITGAAKTLVAGDTLLLTYAGHGGQIRDTSGDEVDGEDETWCLYDGQLLDDELFELWALFAPGVRVHVVSDSCHSGTVTRGLDLATESAAERDGLGKPRVMPLAIGARTYRANCDFYDGVQRQLAKHGWDEDAHEQDFGLTCTVRLYSGCSDEQVSYDGTTNGRFTQELLKVWAEGRFEGTHATFMETILAGMPAYQSPQHRVIGQPDPAWDARPPFSW